MTDPVVEYRRVRILRWFLAQLATIQVANEFATDAGLSVHSGFIPELGPDDPPLAIAMVLGRDGSKWQMEHVALTLPVHLYAVAKADLDEPYVAAEVVLGDIKKAIEVEDRRLGRLLTSDLERGSTQTHDRAAGSLVVGVSITYNAPYRERWGHPEV